MRLDDFRISTKINTGCAVLVLLIAVVGMVGARGLDSVADKVVSVRAASDIKEELALARTDIDRFARTGSEDDAAAVNTRIASVLDDAAALRDRLTGAEAEQAASAVAALTEFRSNFETFATIDAAQSERRRALQGYGDAIIEAADALVLEREAVLETAEKEARNADKARQSAFDALQLTAELKENARVAQAAATRFRFTRTEDAAKAANTAVKDIFLGAIRLKKMVKGTDSETVAGKVAAAAQDYRKAFKAVENGDDDGDAADTAIQAFIDVVEEAAAQQREAYARAEEVQKEARLAVQDHRAIAAEGTRIIVSGQQLRLLLAQFEGAASADARTDITARVNSEMSQIGTALVPIMTTLDAAASSTNLDAIRSSAGAFTATFEELTAEADTAQQARAQMASVAEDLRNAMQNLNDAANALLGQTIDTGTLVIYGGIAVAVLVGLLVALLAVFKIVRPINRLTGSMRRIADGDYEADVPGENRGDEIGTMAGAVSVLKTNGQEKLRLEAEQARKEEEAEAAKRQEIEALATAFEDSVMGVLSSVGEASEKMHEAANTLSTSARETSRDTENAASESQVASSNVQAVAGAAEELSSSVNEVNSQIGRCLTASQAASDAAQRTNVSIQDLAQAAEKIGAVVELISDIAEQTNLLALNATIESARAGEAGKGFAVVANEVKGLASQTSKATEEIGALVNSIQSSTGDAVDRIRQIGDTVESVNDIVTSVASAMEEQGAASNEIARNAENAASGTANVVESVDSVSKRATDTGALAERFQKDAESLKNGATELSEAVSRFLGRIRNAA